LTTSNDLKRSRNNNIIILPKLVSIFMINAILMYYRFEGITVSSNVTFGTLFLKNLQKYEGYLKNGKPHGIGTYFWPNGNVYRGEIDNDQKSGLGFFIIRDESRNVSGLFANDKV
jgi:hypothetical protein